MSELDDLLGDFLDLNDREKAGGHENISGLVRHYAQIEVNPSNSDQSERTRDYNLEDNFVDSSMAPHALDLDDILSAGRSTNERAASLGKKEADALSLLDDLLDTGNDVNAASPRHAVSPRSPMSPPGAPISPPAFAATESALDLLDELLGAGEVVNELPSPRKTAESKPIPAKKAPESRRPENSKSEPQPGPTAKSVPAKKSAELKPKPAPAPSAAAIDPLAMLDDLLADGNEVIDKPPSDPLPPPPFDDLPPFPPPDELPPLPKAAVEKKNVKPVEKNKVAAPAPAPAPVKKAENPPPPAKKAEPVPPAKKAEPAPPAKKAEPAPPKAAAIPAKKPAKSAMEDSLAELDELIAVSPGRRVPSAAEKKPKSSLISAAVAAPIPSTPVPEDVLAELENAASLREDAQRIHVQEKRKITADVLDEFDMILEEKQRRATLATHAPAPVQPAGPSAHNDALESLDALVRGPDVQRTRTTDDMLDDLLAEADQEKGPTSRAPVPDPNPNFARTVKREEPDDDDEGWTRVAQPYEDVSYKGDIGLAVTYPEGLTQQQRAEFALKERRRLEREASAQRAERLAEAKRTEARERIQREKAARSAPSRSAAAGRSVEDMLAQHPIEAMDQMTRTLCDLRGSPLEPQVVSNIVRDRVAELREYASYWGTTRANLQSQLLACVKEVIQDAHKFMQPLAALANDRRAGLPEDAPTREKCDMARAPFVASFTLLCQVTERMRASVPREALDAHLRATGEKDEASPSNPSNPSNPSGPGSGLSPYLEARNMLAKTLREEMTGKTEMVMPGEAAADGKKWTQESLAMAFADLSVKGFQSTVQWVVTPAAITNGFDYVGFAGLVCWTIERLSWLKRVMSLNAVQYPGGSLQHVMFMLQGYTKSSTQLMDVINSNEKRGVFLFTPEMVASRADLAGVIKNAVSNLKAVFPQLKTQGS